MVFHSNLERAFKEVDNTSRRRFDPHRKRELAFKEVGNTSRRKYDAHKRAIERAIREGKEDPRDKEAQDFFSRQANAILKRREQAVGIVEKVAEDTHKACLLYTSPSPRDRTRSRMPSSA